jgi:hypothetical protein
MLPLPPHAHADHNGHDRDDESSEASNESLHCDRLRLARPGIEHPVRACERGLLVISTHLPEWTRLKRQATSETRRHVLVYRAHSAKGARACL